MTRRSYLSSSSISSVTPLLTSYGYYLISTDRNAHKLESILEKALGREMVLPERKISTVEELLEVFPNVGDLLINGTERPIRRPKDDRETERKLLMA